MIPQPENAVKTEAGGPGMDISKALVSQCGSNSLASHCKDHIRTDDLTLLVVKLG